MSNVAANLEVAKVRILPDGRMSRADAAVYLGCAAKTLSDYQRFGRGPMPRKVGGRVFYRAADLEAFVATGAREAEA